MFFRALILKTKTKDTSSVSKLKLSGHWVELLADREIKLEYQDYINETGLCLPRANTGDAKL